jgi:hypothetical protein
MIKSKLWRKVNEQIWKRRERNPRASNAITVECSYAATDDDFYIGVNSEKSVTITLPTTRTNGKIIIIKAEMTPPLYNRKITIKSADGRTIDGYSELTISVSHDCKKLLFNGDKWHII